MSEDQKIQKRQVAYKARIKDIVNGKYVKQEGWQPNYVETESGRQISRANIIATVVQKTKDPQSNYNNLVLDDGSSKISVRSFEQQSIFSNIEIGDVTLLIGRPREFGSEKYMLAEILKKLDNPLWIKVRKLEFEKLFDKEIEIKKDEPTEIATHEAEEIEEMGVKESKTTKKLTDSEAIYNLVKEIDQGDGADIEEVIKQSKVNQAEHIITGLLEDGELFEVRSGMLKVLE